MARFFVSKDKISENTILITDADAHHIARSLRMAEGDEATVCDGEGAEYLCTLVRIRDEECVLEIKEKIDGKTESPIFITLCMAYPKGDKLETVIQKAVELGASRIIPFESSRCIKRPKAEKMEKQTQRLSRIPEVTRPMSYSEMLTEAAGASLSLLCYENEDGKTLKDALPEKMPESISVIVGSEGGFSPEEAAMAKEAGAVSVSLGNRILRCETAPSFALSALSFRYEIKLSMVCL